MQKSILAALLIGFSLQIAIATEKTIQMNKDYELQVAKWMPDIFNGGGNPKADIEPTDKKNSILQISYSFGGKDDKDNFLKYGKEYSSYIIFQKNLSPRQDISEFDSVRFRIYNPDQELKEIVLYLSATEENFPRRYPCELHIGWQEIEIPINMQQLASVKFGIFSSAELADGKKRHILFDGIFLRKNAPSAADIRELLAPSENGGYFIWSKDYMIPLKRNKIQLTEKATTETTTVNLYMGKNEKETFSIVISNLKEKTLAGRIVLTRLKDKAGNLLFPDFITLRSPVFTELRGGKLVDDAIPRLNEINEFHAPPMENQEILFTVDSSKLAPGEYSGLIEIRPFENPGSFDIKVIKLAINVLPVDLGGQHLRLQMFEMVNYIWYPEKMRSFNLRKDEFTIPMETWPEYIKDMANHRVNVFRPVEAIVPYPIIDPATLKITEPLDNKRLSLFDHILDSYKKYGSKDAKLNVAAFMVDTYLEKKGIKPLSNEWKTALSIYFSALIEHLKKAGFSEDAISLYIYDEIKGKTCYKFCEVAKIIKDINPHIKIFLTQNTLAQIDDMKINNPYVDIWGPYITHKNSTFDFLKNTNKPIWLYANNEYSGQTAPPINVRRLAWFAWDKGLQGIGSWAYNCWIGDIWDDYDNFHTDPLVATRGAETYVYWGPQGPVSSRRWEAMRDTMEDYEILFLLNQVIIKAKAKNIPTKDSVELLTHSVEEALNSSNPVVFSKVRVNLMNEIIKLQSAVGNPGQLK